MTLTSSLPAITKSYTINGAGITINGANTYQAFQVASGVVVIQNVKVENAFSKGGDGGGGLLANGDGGFGAGGGGSGLGGAIYVQSESTLTIVDAQQISNNSAVAGLGGSSTNAADPGYIAAGNGSAIGQDIFVREQGSLIFNLSNTLTIATPIEGDQTNGPNTLGGLQKKGNGILYLNGANTYSGTTTVDAGILNLNGSVIGNALIGSGGTLSGNATILGHLTNSGIIHIDINSNGSNSFVTVNGTTSLAEQLLHDLARSTRRSTPSISAICDRRCNWSQLHETGR